MYRSRFTVWIFIQWFSLPWQTNLSCGMRIFMYIFELYIIYIFKLQEILFNPENMVNIKILIYLSNLS